MAKFKDSKIFIIINDSDITTEMVNYSTSKSKQEMPSKLVGEVTKRILETEEPAAAVFYSFVWYGIDDISAVWEAL